MRTGRGLYMIILLFLQKLFYIQKLTNNTNNSYELFVLFVTELPYISE